MQRGIVMSALNDKIVIVTGGSSGIGRAAALNFAKKGAKVVIAGRRTVPLAIAAGPTEPGALTGMMGLSPEQGCGHQGTGARADTAQAARQSE